MHPLFTITRNPDSFLDQIFSGLADHRIEVTNFELDHICYRTSNLEQYDLIKTKLLEIADLLVESDINGRPIATYKLREPIVYKDRKIYCIEVPAPKSGSPYRAGFEHVEFVIKESFEDFKKRYPNVVFDEKGSKKKVNPDIRLGLGLLSVKFHHQTLEEVIAIEKNIGL